MVKRLITGNEENELTEMILRYATQHNLTVSNIMGAVQKVREYMADNATLTVESGFMYLDEKSWRAGKK